MLEIRAGTPQGKSPHSENANSPARKRVLIFIFFTLYSLTFRLHTRPLCSISRTDIMAQAAVSASGLSVSVCAVRLSVCPSVCLSVCPSVCLSVCPVGHESVPGASIPRPRPRPCIHLEAEAGPKKWRAAWAVAMTLRPRGRLEDGLGDREERGQVVPDRLRKGSGASKCTLQAVQ